MHQKHLSDIDTPAPSSNKHELVVDTGSAVSILPQHLYEQYLSDIPLLPPTRWLVTYIRKKIPVLGCLQVKVSREVFDTTATFFVVKKDTPLLGRDLMRALNICIKGDVLPPVLTTESATTLSNPAVSAIGCETASPPAVMTTNSTPASCIPAVPDIGCAHDFVHKVEIDPTVKPVCQKLRRLPFSVRASVRASVSAELELC